MIPSRRYLGAGVALRTCHIDKVLAGDGPPVVEIIPNHFFGDPDLLARVAECAQVVFHDVCLSLGSEGPLDACALEHLSRIEGLIDTARPVLFSDHLSATRTGDGLDLGHLCPIRYTQDTLARLADKVSLVQERLQVRTRRPCVPAGVRLELGNSLDCPEVALCLLDTRRSIGDRWSPKERSVAKHQRTLRRRRLRHVRANRASPAAGAPLGPA